MNDNRIEELVKKLVEKTKRKEAVWDITSRDNEFILNFDKGDYITTDNWISENGYHSVDLNIRNEKGTSVYSITYNQLEDSENYGFLNNLHKVAKDSYFNVEDTLDDIFKDINSNKIIGKIDDPDKFPW